MTSRTYASAGVVVCGPGTKIQPRPKIAPGTKKQTKKKTELSRPWNVIVHDDPITLMSYVTMVLCRIFGYSQPKARGMMLKVHETGQCIVWTGERERAEVYLTKLHAAQLLATIEKVV